MSRKFTKLKDKILPTREFRGLYNDRRIRPFKAKKGPGTRRKNDPV